MNRHRSGSLPFLLAFFIGVFMMPTSVVRVDAHGLGHEHEQPWRARSSTAIVHVATAARARVVAWLEAFQSHPLWKPGLSIAGLAAALCLVPAEDLVALPLAIGVVAGAASPRVEMGVDPHALDPTFGFHSPAEFLAAVEGAGEHTRIDPRLKPLAVAGGDEHGGHTNPHGGFLLPEAWAPNVLGVGLESDPSVGTLQLDMTTAVLTVNARVDKNHSTSVSGGITMTRTPETKAATDSRGEYEQIRLVAHELVGVTFATERIATQNPIAFAQILSEAYRDEHAGTLLNERLRGKGVTDYEGILNADCLITVTKESSQAADSILGANIVKMAKRCWGYERAVWMANHDTREDVVKAHFASGTGAAPVQLYTTEGGREYLLGRPLFFTEFAATLGDKGDLVLANWSQYLEGILQPVEGASSIHVRFLNRTRCFRFTSDNCGASWWRAPLTPKFGANTLSPYVTIEART